MNTRKRDPKEIIDKQEAGISKKPKHEATASKILFMGNLSPDIQEKDVIQFFVPDGKVVEVCLAFSDTKLERGYGEVEFDTAEAAQKALKRNGKPLLGFPIILNYLVQERGTFPPGSGGDDKYFNMQTVFVRGFGADGNVSASLQNHFWACGKLEQIIIQQLYETCHEKKGEAFICFGNRTAVEEALKKNGTILGGGEITVEEAKPRVPPETEGGQMADLMKEVQACLATGYALFIANLNLQIEEQDVIDFFKSTGETPKVYFVKEGDQFQGYGFVEFATPEAVQKAYKLNTEVLLDQKVFIDFVLKTDKYPSLSGGNESSFEKVRHPQGNSVSVKGFGADVSPYTITTILGKHFGKCGMISRITFPKFYEPDDPEKADAIIKFNNSVCVAKALELNGTVVGEWTLTVEEADDKAEPTGDGSGQGGGHPGTG